MHDNTSDTEWASAIEIPNDIRELIDGYFSLLDTNRGDVGDRLVDEIFAPDAVIHGPKATFEGSDGACLSTATFGLPKEGNFYVWLGARAGRVLSLFKTPPTKYLLTESWCDVPEIRGCRDQAWDTIEERKHTVKRTYVFDSTADDLMLIGEVDQKLRNGQQVQTQWVARLKFSRAADQTPRITYHKVWL